MLVFTRTAGFRHRSIEDGVAAIRRLGRRQGSGSTTPPTRPASARVWAGTGRWCSCRPPGTCSTSASRRPGALPPGRGRLGRRARGRRRRVRDWPWYGGLVGAWFRRHPAVQRPPSPRPWRRRPGREAVRGLGPQRRVVRLRRQPARPGPGCWPPSTSRPTAAAGWGRPSHRLVPGVRRWLPGYSAMGHTGESFREPEFLSTCWPASAMPPGRPRPAAPPAPNRRRAGGGSGG